MISCKNTNTRISLTEESLAEILCQIYIMGTIAGGIVKLLSANVLKIV